MRKSLIALLVAAALCAGGVLWAHVAVGAAEDAVTLEETVLYGDRAALEGLSLHVRTQCDSHLFWDTAFVPGTAPEIETQFAFSQARRSEEHEIRYDGLGLFNFDFGMGSTAAIEQEMMFGLEKLFLDVADRTEPDRQHTETIRLKYYYDEFPFTFHLDLPGLRYNQFSFSRLVDKTGETVVRALAAFFRIPVPSDYLVEVSVQKNADGEIIGLNIIPLSEIDFFMESLVMDTACYFTFGDIGKEGALDMSQVPGGYGIYRLPYTLEEYGTTVDVDELEMVFPLKAGVTVRELRASSGERELLMVTQEDGRNYLTVIDARNMREKQKLERLPAGEYGGLYSYYAEDFIFYCRDDGRFQLLERAADGTYTIKLDAYADEDQAQHAMNGWTQSLDWNGTRLAWAGLQFEGERYNNEKCGFYLSIFDATGLLFSGRYDSSLDEPDSSEFYAKRCEPVDVDPLTVSWG